jgi:hypothetical protein
MPSSHRQSSRERAPLFNTKIKQKRGANKKMRCGQELICVLRFLYIRIIRLFDGKFQHGVMKDFLKELSVAIKQARKYSYTLEEKRIFITAVTAALKRCKVSPFAWSFGKQWSYWKFRLFLR